MPGPQSARLQNRRFDAPGGRISLTGLLARPETLPPLPRDAVALWVVHRCVELPAPQAALALLDPGERQRADAFLRPQDRCRFILAHAALRAILAAHTRRGPGDIAYQCSERGKPGLAPGGPQFNLSHAGDCVLVAVSVLGPVGVDVEPVRALPDAGALVERCFAAQERRAYQACPEAGRARAFFTLWTRKEAYAKALGLGLGLGFDTFAVSLDDPARLLRRAHPGPAGPPLRDIPAPAGYVGALAAQADKLVVRELIF